MPNKKPSNQDIVHAFQIIADLFRKDTTPPAQAEDSIQLWISNHDDFRKMSQAFLGAVRTKHTWGWELSRELGETGISLDVACHNSNHLTEDEMFGFPQPTFADNTEILRRHLMSVDVGRHGVTVEPGTNCSYVE